MDEEDGGVVSDGAVVSEEAGGVVRECCLGVKDVGTLGFVGMFVV